VISDLRLAETNNKLPQVPVTVVQIGLGEYRYLWRRRIRHGYAVFDGSCRYRFAALYLYDNLAERLRHGADV
jgi:hypothetical protein